MHIMKNIEERIAEIEKNARPDSAIDFSDIPELTDEQLKQLRPSHLVDRNIWKPRKIPTTIRLDADSLDYLHKSGAGWQTRVNAYIREGIESGRL